MLRLHSSLLYSQGVELLVNRGADLEAQNNDGETPLHIMARRRRLGCVVMLLSVGANVNAQSSDGSTPLHYAGVVSSKHSYRGFDSSSLFLFSWLKNFVWSASERKASALDRMAFDSCTLLIRSGKGDTEFCLLVYVAGCGHASVECSPCFWVNSLTLPPYHYILDCAFSSWHVLFALTLSNSVDFGVLHQKIWICLLSLFCPQ